MMSSAMTVAFDSPVGTADERRTGKVWPGGWIDATGYANRYPPYMMRSDYHTGADLNLNVPKHDADAHAPCYAAADGIVCVAGLYAIWGAILIIKHDGVPETGTVWTRYAHLEAMSVKTGQMVTRGQEIGRIGNANGRYAYHLHFDVARVDLGEHPTDWPNADLKRLRTTYFDPKQFILDHLQILEGGETVPLSRVVGASPRLRIRKDATVKSAIVGYVEHGAVVKTLTERDGWGLIAEPVPGWIDLKWTRLCAD
jgi:murein DD-endopeptidase MepM/ murein hydrolase activator NlpD